MNQSKFHFPNNLFLECVWRSFESISLFWPLLCLQCGDVRAEVTNDPKHFHKNVAQTVEVGGSGWKNYTVKSHIVCESCCLAVEHSAHDRKVVGLIPMLDGSGVKAMPGSIPTPNPGSFKNWKYSSQMGHTKKYFFLKWKKGVF